MLVALLLNPLVRAFTRLRIPRGFGVAIVFLAFAAAVVVAIVALVAVVVDQGRRRPTGSTPTLRRRADGPATPARRWTSTACRSGSTTIAGPHPDREQARDSSTPSTTSGSTRTTLDYAEGAALGIFEFLFALVLIIVVCIYMLLDMPRLQRSLDRRFPPPGAPSSCRRSSRQSAATSRARCSCR